MKFRVLQVEKGFLVQRRRFWGLWWDSLGYKGEYLWFYQQEMHHVFRTKKEAIKATKDLRDHLDKPKRKKEKFKNKVVWVEGEYKTLKDA